MNVTEETKDHAQHILNYLKAFPERHAQSEWVFNDNVGNRYLDEDNFCGTTMCVAGTSVFLADGVEGLRIPLRKFEVKARDNLGLTEVEANQLFYTMDKNKALLLLQAVANGDKASFESIYVNVDDD